MKKFKIADLERFSTIKAHTFRTWELRYQTAPSKRSETGSRYYTLADVEHLLTTALLNKAGYKISTIIKMDEAAKHKALQAPLPGALKKEKIIYKLIGAMYRGDIEEFEFLLDNCVNHWQTEAVVTEIIFPFLDRVGLMCYADTNAETHFVVTTIRSKIIFATETLKVKEYSAKKAMLFLPKGEHYDLILLYINFLLKRQGIRTFYLGANLSIADLKPVLLSKKPDLLITYIYPRQKAGVSLLNEFLQTHLPQTKLYQVAWEPLLNSDATGADAIILCNEIEEWVTSREN